MKLVFIIICSLLAIPAVAEEESLTLKKAVKTDEKIKEGWTPKLKFGTNFSINSSNQVVGQADGDSVTVGLNIKGGLTYKKELAEWRQSLDYEGTTTKTPALPRYVKSADKLDYKTLYLRGLEKYPWIGPYARVTASTALFRGEDVQASDKEYINSTNGGASLGTHSTYPLTEAFKPLSLSESVGLFAKIKETKTTLLEVRIGLGAVQYQADGQFRVDDSTATQIELKELNDSEQVGLEYGLVFSGKWDDKSDYSLTADFLTPLDDKEIKTGDPCDTCTTLEKTTVDVKASIGTKLTEWAKLAYEYKAVNQPLVVDKFQIQHGVVLNIDYSIY